MQSSNLVLIVLCFLVLVLLMVLGYLLHLLVEVLTTENYRLTVTSQSLLNQLRASNPSELRTLQQVTQQQSPESRFSQVQEDLTDPNLAAAAAEAMFEEDELAASGFTMGDINDDLYASGYDPVIARVSPESGEPIGPFYGTGLNA